MTPTGPEPDHFYLSTGGLVFLSLSATRASAMASQHGRTLTPDPVLIQLI